MNKKLFKECMLAIKNQMKYDDKCTKAFQTILPNDFISGYNNSILQEQLIAVLKEYMHDFGDWVNYFIWDLEFGNKWHEGCVTQDDKDVKLKTIDDLWELLENNKKGDEE